MLPGGAFGAAIQPEISASGIDISACRKAAPQEVPVVISTPKDRAFLTHRTGPALPKSFAKALTRPGLRHLHIAELATLIEHPELIKSAKALGLSLSLDCAWDEAALDHSLTMDLLRGVDVFLPNEAEVLRFTGMGNSLTEAASALAKTGALLVIKCGENGAVFWEDGQLRKAPARAGDARDTTGAGDAFNAGFLLEWLRGAPKMACLKRGNEFGYAAIQYPGGASAARHLAALSPT